MALIAITGGIGSGKSTVADLLYEQGYPLIDTDEVKLRKFCRISNRFWLQTAIFQEESNWNSFFLSRSPETLWNPTWKPTIKLCACLAPKFWTKNLNWIARNLAKSYSMIRSKGSNWMPLCILLFVMKWVDRFLFVCFTLNLAIWLLRKQKSTFQSFLLL